DNEDDFVLEEDTEFGLGEIEGNLPPFDSEPATPAANESAPAHALSGDDPFALTAPAHPAPQAHAVLTRDDTRTTEQPVPRITIHASCDRPEIADIISAITADRRMARAEISVEPGGIDAAVIRFASQASPNLLIL